jgi:hypothetical protein
MYRKHCLAALLSLGVTCQPAQAGVYGCTYLIRSDRQAMGSLALQIGEYVFPGFDKSPPLPKEGSVWLQICYDKFGFRCARLELGSSRGKYAMRWSDHTLIVYLDSLTKINYDQYEGLIKIRSEKYSRLPTTGKVAIYDIEKCRSGLTAGKNDDSHYDPGPTK